MIPPFNSVTQSGMLIILPSGVTTSDALATRRPVATHGLALAGIIGGVALGVCVVWLLVARIRLRKLKANVASTGTSESSPLLVQYQAPIDLQTHTAKLENDILLCSTCAKLDFFRILSYGIHELEPIPLGPLSSILEKSYQCSFCRLISLYVRRTRVLENSPHIDLSEIQCEVYTMLCGALRRGPHPPLRYGRRLHVTGKGLFDTHPDFRAAGSLIIHLMQEDAFKFRRPVDLHGRRVKNTVDIGLVKKWIKLCQENHGDECRNIWRTDRNLPGFVRVVDVVSMAVIPAPSGCRCVALSYVWGSAGAEYWTTKDNIAGRSTPGGLNAANLPDTITDSILFVRQIGERYIWIDALCIIQDDLQDKSYQLNAMDLVYGLSYFTLIAAGGKSARDPLPGCRPRTRTPQIHTEVVQGLHLFMAPPRHTEALAMSTWVTRCWTYQESALSCRRIYFTEQQVCFECQCQVFCEDIVGETKAKSSSSFLWHLRGEHFPFSSDLFWSYQLAVEKYTPRNLTVESDIVDALTGVTNALTVAFGLGDPARAFQYGMMLTDLHHALLWQHEPHTPRARRSLAEGGSSSWPSWAWATWRGAVIYMGRGVYRRTPIASTSNEASVDETLIDTWYIVDHSGDTVQLDVRRVSRVYWIEEEQPPIYSSPRGILDPTELTLDNHRPLQPGTLIFRTTSSHFGIVRRGSEENEEPGPVQHYGLFNILSTSSPPIWVGSVILPLDPALPTSIEFIVLSRCDSVDGLWDAGSLKRYHGCLLHVMAVRENEGLMERVGLGVVHIVAWVASMPEEKVVFLR
ncbi:heterokaryon incompatibility protein-domain-containing protein [Suillus clintonianus]|uniref:heterokaryon incompatibility protein-domain-containing protein n=1 Tax=Suillus clintonianus TaxID=1904413 RepID=UPI001B872615|nr:heterokaryon incompatibility protein-domain-containing protein [Suillus clintonianus]KAG2141000.1 heterokaryon incompatibility protein-domain-containing protein [Suillus clintonianus]